MFAIFACVRGRRFPRLRVLVTFLRLSLCPHETHPCLKLLKVLRKVPWKIPKCKMSFCACFCCCFCFVFIFVDRYDFSQHEQLWAYVEHTTLCRQVSDIFEWKTVGQKPNYLRSYFSFTLLEWKNLGPRVTLRRKQHLQMALKMTAQNRCLRFLRVDTSIMWILRFYVTTAYVV